MPVKTITLVLTFASLLTLGAYAAPQDLKVSFQADKDRDKDKMAHEKMGEGDKIVTRYDFRFSISNLTSEPCNSIAARVYVLAEPYDFSNDSERKVVKVLEKKDILADVQSTTVVDMESVDMVITKTMKGSMFWRSGMEYKGYLAELSIDGKIFFTDSSGGSATKKAVANYLQNPGGKQK